jgi:tetratricopeptide (TPR) repeat protein
MHLETRGDGRTIIHRSVVFMKSTTVIALTFLLLTAGVVCAAAISLQAIDAYNQGVDLAEEGKFSEALSAVDQALAMDPNFTLAWVTRAGILTATGNFTEALEASDRAVALNPNQSEAWTNRASALIQLDRNTEALESADRAIEIDPRLSEAWIDRATALSNLNRTEEANEALQMVRFLTEPPATTTTPAPSPTKSPLPWVAGLAALGGAAWLARIKR